MNYSQLRATLAESKLSPEQLAPHLGVASMTIRRWKDEPGKKQVPKGYERSVVEGIYHLMIEGHLSSESKVVQEAISDSTSLSFQAALQGLGVSTESLQSKSNHEDKMTVVLHQIGSSEKRRKQVESSKSKILSFKKLGQEWRRRISTLMKVIQSSKLSLLDKFVAYGALFYLICPFDLIPDHIPVIGLVDDFGILGFAAAYYLRKFPKLFAEGADSRDEHALTSQKSL